MAGDPGYLEHPAAEVQGHDLLRPAADAEELSDVPGGGADHGGVRAPGELGRIGAGRGIEQNRALVAEQQEDERCLEGERLADSQDERVLVAAVDLNRRVGAPLARGRAVNPGGLGGPGHRRARTEVDTRGACRGARGHELMIKTPAVPGQLAADGNGRGRGSRFRSGCLS